MAERTPRELDTRARAERSKKWMPPELLPVPLAANGFSYRWIRVSTLGTDDPKNISSKLREGWEPVKASDHPEIQLLGTGNARFPDSIEVGGLILCKTPSEFVDQRNDFYRQDADSHMRAIDNNFMRESDARMPLFRERRSEVSFGRGS